MDGDVLVSSDDMAGLAICYCRNEGYGMGDNVLVYGVFVR
jgi:hypothetical protein